MTDMATEDTELEIKKSVKEIPVVQDQGFFQHTTGDTYDGFFEAKKKDRSLKMHGPGAYTTAEGDVYTGTWENDKLGGNDEATIRFNDTSSYEGTIKDWSYTGSGKYFYPDGSILICDFAENCPTGLLTLLDPNVHTWMGKAKQGFGWLEPINHYYAMLDKTKETDRVKRRHKHSISPN